MEDCTVIEFILQTLFTLPGDSVFCELEGCKSERRFVQTVSSLKLVLVPEGTETLGFSGCGRDEPAM